jgi:diazepam-binding inhibitor (GABA receptor modulator, acyl-CoA-binding protein)
VAKRCLIGSKNMSRLLPPRLFSCQSPVFTPEKDSFMEVKSLFEKAVEDSKSLSNRPSNDTLLQLYSLFKQATEGDANENASPTSPFDFVAKAKYEAWLALKGKPQQEAQKEYVNLVSKLKG